MIHHWKMQLYWLSPSFFQEMAVSMSRLFSSAVLKAWRREHKITPANLGHLHTLSKANALF
jgi:hypothetical protein